MTELWSTTAHVLGQLEGGFRKEVHIMSVRDLFNGHEEWYNLLLRASIMQAGAKADASSHQVAKIHPIGITDFSMNYEVHSTLMNESLMRADANSKEYYLYRRSYCAPYCISNGSCNSTLGSLEPFLFSSRGLRTFTDRLLITLTRAWLHDCWRLQSIMHLFLAALNSSMISTSASSHFLPAHHLSIPDGFWSWQAEDFTHRFQNILLISLLYALLAFSLKNDMHHE